MVIDSRRFSWIYSLKLRSHALLVFQSVFNQNSLDQSLGWWVKILFMFNMEFTWDILVLTFVCKLYINFELRLSKFFPKLPCFFPFGGRHSQQPLSWAGPLSIKPGPVQHLCVKRGIIYQITFFTWRWNFFWI